VPGVGNDGTGGMMRALIQPLFLASEHVREVKAVWVGGRQVKSDS
jgi:hypothetical protein